MESVVRPLSAHEPVVRQQCNGLSDDSSSETSSYSENSRTTTVTSHVSHVLQTDSLPVGHVSRLRSPPLRARQQPGLRR